MAKFLTTARFMTMAKLLPMRANLDRRTDEISGALSKGAGGFGRADVGSGARFTAHEGLQHHGPRYNSLLFLDVRHL